MECDPQSLGRAVHARIEAHNRDVVVDVTVRGGLGAFWCLFTFGALFVVAWLLFSWLVAWLVVIVYFGVAWWSALRGVDPWAHLAPISREEKARRDVEQLVSIATGASVANMRRDSLAGKAAVLIAGPKSVLEAWRSYKRILPQEEDLSARAGAILAECPQMYAADLDARSCLILGRLGLIAVETDEDGDVHMNLTTKGRKLMDEAG